MSKSIVLFLSAAIPALISTSVVSAGETGSPLDPDLIPMVEPHKTVIVDDPSWPRFNWMSFDQDKLVSWGDHQYSVYWNADRLLTLVRRDLNTDETQVLAFPNYVLAEGLSERQQNNAHRNIVVGLSPGDGRVHLSWDHHNNDLNYTRSRPGFVTDPPAEMTLEDFEPKQPLTDGAPQNVTYPRFFNDHKENLFFFFRSGGSGRGDIALFEYDHAKGTWTMISNRLFGREGVYPDWNNSDSRNAYMHDLLFDDRGRLHITWIYRETFATWASNHDLHYAYSDDRGRTWKNNAGQQIADTRKGEQILLDSPGIRVREIPVFSWLMNQCGMTLDSQNRPHVATFHMAEPWIPDEVEHDPPAEEHHRLNYYHYWRDRAGTWHRSDPLPVPTPRRRPMIVAAPDDTIVIYFTTPDGFMAHVAGPEDGYRHWHTVRLTGPEFRVNDTTKHDRRRLREENILSFTADPRGVETGSGFAFLDFSLELLTKPEGTDRSP
jgi:hypothetical protein